MANIKQQKKRVGTAARQRLENLRYRSAIKTEFRKLEAHVDAGESDDAAKVHSRLVVLIDRAVARRVLHANTAARKKSRAARVLTQDPKPKAQVTRKPKKTTRKTAAKKPAAKKTDAKKTDAKDAEAQAETKKPAAKKPAAKKADAKDAEAQAETKKPAAKKPAAKKADAKDADAKAETKKPAAKKADDDADAKK